MNLSIDNIFEGIVAVIIAALIIFGIDSCNKTDQACRQAAFQTCLKEKADGNCAAVAQKVCKDSSI